MVVWARAENKTINLNWNLFMTISRDNGESWENATSITKGGILISPENYGNKTKFL